MIELVAMYCSTPEVCEKYPLAQYEEDKECVEQLIELNTSVMREYFESQRITIKCVRVLEGP